MDEELLDELENSSSEPNNNPDERPPLIPDGPVDNFFNEFDANHTGDPFRNIQEASRKFGEKFQAVESGTGGLYDSSETANRLFSNMAEGLFNSSSSINERQSKLQNLSLINRLDSYSPSATGRLGSEPLTTGFVGRAGISEYRNIINQPGKLQGVFFQLQQKDILSSLVNRKDSFSLVTQKLTFANNSVDNTRTTASILAGNEISAAIGRSIQTRDNLTSNPVLQIKSFASFHPKVGFVGDREKGGTAFIGTQNLTPALSGNNSLETLMSFSMLPGARNLSTEVSSAAKTESSIATEILEMTEAITGMATPGYLYAPGGIQKELKKRSSSRAFLYTESEIYGRVSKALKTAAFDGRSVSARDRVIISMGEISLLLNKGGYASDMVRAVKQLAIEKRLTIVTDERKMRTLFDSYRSNVNSPTSLRLNVDLLQTLISQGALKTASTGYQHDKTIAIFSGSTKNLRFISTGSANMSADSMMPVGLIPKTTDEYFSGSLQALRRTLGNTDYDLNSPMNADTVLALGLGPYADTDRDIKGNSVEAYLGKLDAKGELSSHYNELAGGFLFRTIDNTNFTPIFNSGFHAEKNSSEKDVEILKKATEELAKSLGSNIKVTGRYDLNKLGSNGLAKLSGITVTINNVDGIGTASTKINLTVDQSGNVIISDTNRVITGSIFVNKSTEVMNIAGRTVAAGKHLNLSSLDTALGLIGTLAREVNYNARFSSIGDVFATYAKKNVAEVKGLARDLIAQTIHKAIPELQTLDGSNVNLNSISRAIKSSEMRNAGVDATQIFDETEHNLTFSQNSVMDDFINGLTNREKDLRANVVKDLISLLRDNHSEKSPQKDNGIFSVMETYLAEAVGSALNIDDSELYRNALGEDYGPYMVGHVLSSQILQSDTLGLFNDLKYEILNKSSRGREALALAQSVQAKRLLADLSSPFLAAHELGHSANQAKYRRPVYSESDIHQGNSNYDKTVRAGFLNPAPLSASTKVGNAGEYIALVGAASHAKPLKSVGYGGVRQVTTVNADISTGAAIRYDTNGIFNSTSGLSVFTPTDILNQNLRMLSLMNIDMSEEDLLEYMESQNIAVPTEALYFLSFNKAEQISQRLKNQLGGRPTLDVNKDFARKVRNLDTNLDISSSALSGRIRESLPKEQFNTLQQKLKEYGGDQSKVESYFRDLELKTTTTEHGIIGPTSMKKVGIIGGFSLIGDTSYLNADYDQEVGSMHTMSVSIASSSVTNQSKAELILAKYLQKGNRIISSATQPENYKNIESVANTISRLNGGNLDVDTLQGIMENASSGEYKNYFFKKKNGKFQAYYKEGLYSQNESGFERIGKFNRDGQIVVEGLSTTSETHNGLVSQPIFIKMPTFGKRHEGGVSVIMDSPTVLVENGKIKIISDIFTIYNPGTNSRPVGMALHKGPLEYITKKVFEEINKRFGTIKQGEFTPIKSESLALDKVYGLFSTGHFKGFNVETGLFLLAKEDTRKSIYNLSGESIATSLSLLFMSENDTDISKALREHLRNKGLGFAAEAFKQASNYTKDYSNKSKKLGFIGQGLASLAESPDSTGVNQGLTGDLSSLKQTVIRALKGEQSARDHLATQNKKLIDLVTSDPSTVAKNSEGKIVSILENDSINRGAGFLAHTSFLMGQLTSSKANTSIGTVYQFKLDDIHNYLTDVSYKIKIDAIAAKAGIKMPVLDGKENTVKEIEEKLKLLQALQRNEKILMDYKDTSLSKSLVATGMHDSVSLEYQYLLGVSNNYIGAFESASSNSEKSKALKHAYGIIASAGRSVASINPDSKLKYQIALTSDREGFMSHQEIEAQRLIMSYTPLGDSLGFFDEAITGLAGGDSKKLDTLQLVQQIATATLGDSEESFVTRGIALNKEVGLLYFSNTKDRAGQIQSERLRDELKVSRKSSLFKEASSLTPQEFVGRIVSQSYDLYLMDNKSNTALGNKTQTFNEYVSETGGIIKTLEDKYGVVGQITNKKGRITGTTDAMEFKAIKEKINMQLERINKKSISAIKETYNTEIENNLITGNLEAEVLITKLMLQSPEHNPGYAKLLSAIKETKQIVLPVIQGEYIREGEDAGRFSVRVLRPEDAEMTQGVMLGSDVMRHVALKFPGHIDEVLRYQRSLKEQMISTEKLRGHIYNNGGEAIVNTEEMDALNKLQATTEASALSFQHLADTESVRKAFGDKLNFAGAVGPAIGTFALDPTQVGVGDRYLSVNANSDVARTVSKQFQALKQNVHSSESIKSISATNQLIQAVGLKGPVTESEERASGIASKATVLEAFEQIHQKALNGRLTTEDINHVENLSLSSLANISTERVAVMKKGDSKTLDKLINIGVGSLHRGGAPAGVSGLVNESSISEPVHVTEMIKSIERSGGTLTPDIKRSKTALYAPIVGRNLMQLGDWDGDAYQLLMSGLGNHLDGITDAQDKLLAAQTRINSIETSINNLNYPEDMDSLGELENELRLSRGSLSEAHDNLLTSINTLDERSLKYDRTKLNALQDMRQAVGSYLSLPDYVTNDPNISTGELMTFVQQMSGLLGNVEDTAPFIKKTEDRLNLITSLFDGKEGFQFTEQAISGSDYSVNKLISSAYSRGLVSETEDRDDLRYMFQDLSAQARQEGVSSTSALIDTSRNFFASQANLASTIYSTNKSFDKASGTLLNAMDFEGLQSTVGQAGTELIGKVYNAFVPLLDKSMGEHSISVAMNVEGPGSFSDVMGNRLDAIASDESIALHKREAATALKNSLIVNREETVKRNERRLSGTTGMLGALQQLIRDSLKEKSEKGMAAMLQNASFEGKTLMEAMESVSDSDPVKADKQRLHILKTVVETKIGPDLSSMSGLDGGLTGFGALIQFASIANTKDSQIKTKFIDEKGLTNQYQSSGISSPVDFVLGKVMTMIEHTQASFKASTYSESSTNSYIQSLDSKFGKGFSIDTASDLERKQYEIYQNKKLKPLELIQQITLSEIQQTNKDNGVLTVDQLKELRNIYLETQKIRYGEGSIQERANNLNIESHNAITRDFQRGKSLNSEDSMYMKGAQIDMLSQALKERGVNSDDVDNDQLGEAARVLGFAFGDSDDQKAVFTEALFMKDDLGRSGFDSLRDSTAAMTYGAMGMFQQLYEEQNQENPDARRIDNINEQLSGIMKDGRVQLDEYQRMRANFGSNSQKAPRSKLDADIERISHKPFGSADHSKQMKARRTGTLLDPDSGLEAIGAFAAPLMMIALGSGAKLDDRVGMAALDTFQSLAYISSDSTRRSTEFMGESSEIANFRYTGARIRDAMEQQGLVGGALQGVVQESLFRGGSQFVYKAIDSINTRLGGNKRKAGNAVATIAAETISTVAALSLARGAVKAKTPEGLDVPDRIGDMLKEFSTEVWKNVQIAQERLLDPKYEVIDTDYNNSYDFELSAIPDELSRDIDDGWVVLDEEGGRLEATFSSSDEEQAALVSSF